MRYQRNEVITDPEDTRLHGLHCPDIFTGSSFNETLEKANSSGQTMQLLEISKSAEKPFRTSDGCSYAYIVLKNSKQNYNPLTCDCSITEDLRTLWNKLEGRAFIINAVDTVPTIQKVYSIRPLRNIKKKEIIINESFSGEFLLENATWLDTGLPVGEKIE